MMYILRLVVRAIKPLVSCFERWELSTGTKSWAVTPNAQAIRLIDVLYFGHSGPTIELGAAARFSRSASNLRILNDCQRSHGLLTGAAHPENSAQLVAQIVLLRGE